MNFPPKTVISFPDLTAFSSWSWAPLLGNVHHPFRHTLINHRQREDVSKNRIHAFVGHEDVGLSYYPHDQGLKEIAEKIAKIDYEIDFSRLFDKHRNEYLSM